MTRRRFSLIAQRSERNVNSWLLAEIRRRIGLIVNLSIAKLDNVVSGAWGSIRKLKPGRPCTKITVLCPFLPFRNYFEPEFVAQFGVPFPPPSPPPTHRTPSPSFSFDRSSNKTIAVLVQTWIYQFYCRELFILKWLFRIDSLVRFVLYRMEPSLDSCLNLVD